MKILIVFNHPAPYKVALFNGLAAHHDIHVIFERLKTKDRHHHFYNELTYNFTIHKIKGLNLGNENHLSGGVVSHLKKHKYDLIIMNGYSTFTEMRALRYLKRKKIPYAFYINGGIVKQESDLAKKIKTNFISGAKYYFSPALKANEYLKHYGAPEDKIFNYPYSTIYEKDVLRTKVSDEEKIAYWRAKGIVGENFTISVTSFVKRKNNMALLEEWNNVRKNHPLILVGHGPEERMYQKYIEKNKLDHVHILPFVPKDTVLEYLRHSHNAIYLSNYDIYGHVINEALASGLNVLASPKMVATHAMIKDNVNGYVFDEKISLGAQIEKLIDSDFFNAATSSAVTIEDSVAAHLKILGEIL